jgi:hypothetical protein
MRLQLMTSLLKRESFRSTYEQINVLGFAVRFSSGMPHN